MHGLLAHELRQTGSFTPQVVYHQGTHTIKLSPQVKTKETPTLTLKIDKTIRPLKTFKTVLAELRTRQIPLYTDSNSICVPVRGWPAHLKVEWLKNVSPIHFQ